MWYVKHYYGMEMSKLRKRESHANEIKRDERVRSTKYKTRVAGGHGLEGREEEQLCNRWIEKPEVPALVHL